MIVAASPDVWSVTVSNNCCKSVFQPMGVAGRKSTEKKAPAVVVLVLNDATTGVITKVPLSARTGATVVAVSDAPGGGYWINENTVEAFMVPDANTATCVPSAVCCP